MSTSDKAANKVQEMKGKAKEATGRMAGDRDLEAEGQVDQAAASAKGVGEKLKDAGSKVKDAMKP